MRDRPRNCLVVGASGFVGGHLVGYLTGQGIDVHQAARETPPTEFADRSFDAVFYCAGNSKVYRAETDPVTCLSDDVITLYAYLTSLMYDLWFQVSSSTVYPAEHFDKTESSAAHLQQLTLGAAHKVLAERYVVQFAPKWIIARATAFLANVSRRGLLFDLRSGKRDVHLDTGSWIDYLPIDVFCEIALTLVEKAENEIVNVGSGHCFGVEEVLGMRPGDYVFRDDQHVDDRGISFSRLRAYYPRIADRDEIASAIRDYVNGRD